MAILLAQSTIKGFSYPVQSLLKPVAFVESTGFGKSYQIDLFANCFLEIYQGYFQDYLSSLERFFGKNVKQDGFNLYIQKNDLNTLTALANNKAESLLIALFIQVMQNASESLISNVVVQYQESQLLEDYRIDRLVVLLYPEVYPSELDEININSEISPEWF